MKTTSALRPDPIRMHFDTRGAIVVATAIAIAACACVTPAFGLVKFDFEQGYFNEKPMPVLDHCVVEKDGEYHLLYLRGNPAVDIGHAKTTDFVRWEMLEPVLEPGTWDNHALWAPHLVPVPDFGWYLYYTGVNTVHAQQTGIAFSNDLFGWTKIPWPVYRPDPIWAQWDESIWCHGRDPHVIAYNNKYYMFVTAKTNWGLGAIACAESDDMFNWTDVGPLYVHDSWHVLESVFIMQRNGKWHMFFTEEAVFGTSHVSNDSLFGDWSMANRRIIDTGHAAQITTLNDGTEMFSRHAVYAGGPVGQYHNIRFDELAWAGDIPAPYKPWPLADDWILMWGNAFSYQPVFENNPAVRGDNVATTFEGKCWLGTYERYTGPMGFGTPGGIQDESRTGVIRSKPFTITGNSINLLVGGGDDIDAVYVALVDNLTNEVLFKETGRNSDEMDRRYWNVAPFKGSEVSIEIADLSTGAFGHINCDDITESWDIVDEGAGGTGDDSANKTKKTGLERVDALGNDTPSRPALRQNTPNPFNPVTSISYDVPERGHVTLQIYDVSGKLVRSLVNGEKQAGTHTVSWNGLDKSGMQVSSGVYLYRFLFRNELVETRKMMMLK